jgi:hypothetical protein
MLRSSPACSIYIEYQLNRAPLYPKTYIGIVYMHGIFIELFKTPKMLCVVQTTDR